MSAEENKIEEGSIKCYVCGLELKPQFSTKIAEKPSDTDISGEYAEMRLWNGTMKPVCSDCYKAHKTGLNTYFQRLGN